MLVFTCEAPRVEGATIAFSCHSPQWAGFAARRSFARKSSFCPTRWPLSWSGSRLRCTCRRRRRKDRKLAEPQHQQTKLHREHVHRNWNELQWQTGFTICTVELSVPPFNSLSTQSAIVWRKKKYFCILFSMTGRTALIQSSWLHVPVEKKRQILVNEYCRTHQYKIIQKAITHYIIHRHNIV